MPLWRQLEIARYLTKFPALTVMVLLRDDIGYRLLNPFHLFWTAGALVFAAQLFDPSYPNANWVDLELFAILTFLAGMYHRAKRWLALRRGELSHSYYIGTSGFDRLPFPKFLRRNRRLSRFGDPLACAFMGFYVMPHSHVLGLWLVFAGMCLRVFEATVHQKEFNQSLDVLDGLIQSEVHTKDVETFERPRETQPAPKHQPTNVIPTGVGADILPQIKNRRK